ncbi:integrase, catalytic region, zinc finger, CCHC-type containing protein [Tanacetum coccineum]
MVFHSERVKNTLPMSTGNTVPREEETVQFWYSIKKIQGTDSYEFLLANKKCVVNADVFRTILDICPRVEGVNFTDVPDDDTTLAFLIKLGYKGPLYKHTNMFVDHMHQPWRTLAVSTSVSLERQQAMTNYIDHRKEKRSRRENMSFPRFTKVIINHFLKQHNSLSNLKYQHYHTIKDDGITMLTEAIKQSESYQMFIAYSTGQIPPKKNRGKGSQRKKTADDSQETVDVSEESEPEPEPAKRKTSSKRRVKKKDICWITTLSVDEPNTGIMTESIPEPSKRRKSGKVTSDPLKKLKGTKGSSEGTSTKPGVPDESTVVSATSSEGTSTKPGVPDEEKEITEENYKIRVRKDEDEEMINAEVDDYDKGDEHITNAAKADAEKTLEIHFEVPHTQSPSTLSEPVFVISEPTVLTLVQESPSKAIVTTLPPPSVSTTPSVPQQTTTPIPIPPITINASIITTAVYESDALSDVQLRVAKLEKDVSDLKKLDVFSKCLRANESPPMLEKENYIPWESQFRRFLDNKLEDEERMWNSIQNNPYQRPMVVDPTNSTVQILEPLSKTTEGTNQKVMHGSEITTHVRHSRLMDEFDKFVAKEGESLDSVLERLTTLVNIMDRELQGNSQEDKLTTAMMLLAQEISQKFSTPTNNRYGRNANNNAERNKTQGFNASDESNQIIQHVPRTESTPGKANVQCYNCNEKGHYARECQKPKVHDSKYFREQMLLAIKDEAESNLSNEENDFMLDTSYGEDLEELTAAVHTSSKFHEQVSHGKRKTIIQTTDDDQIDSNIIFDDLFVENNGGTSEHDSTAHDEYCEIQMLAYNVQREAENQKRLNNELKKEKDLLQRELETFKDRVKTFESKTVHTQHTKKHVMNWNVN